MHRVKEAATIIKDINKYKNNELPDYALVGKICNYFDKIKDAELNQADLKFLRYIANIAGIPHYYDLLSNFKDDTEIRDINLNTLSSLIYESSLHTSENTKVHRYQQKIIDSFNPDTLNRFFLSASTSFGKTYVVYEIIKKMEYKNIVLIFLNIVLLSENLEKIYSNPQYIYFKENFKIHTLSEVSELGENNLFIYTPERFLSYTDKNAYKFDFVFIDEIYKLDNEYLDEDIVKENERDVAYRLATFYSLIGDSDVLLAGPYIEFPETTSINYNDSFNEFLKQNKFTVLDYNNYEIVNKFYTEIKTQNVVNIDDKLSINFNGEKKVAPRLC